MSSKLLELWLDRSQDPNGIGSALGHPYEKDITRVWMGRQPQSPPEDGVAEITLEDKQSQKDALSLVGMVEYIFVRCPDWTMIPLENLVAACQGTSTKVACSLQSAQQVQGAAKALQIGVDVVVLEWDDTLNGEAAAARDALWAAVVEEVRARPQSGAQGPDGSGAAGPDARGAPASSSIVPATVTKVSSCRTGERVCVDLIECLVPGEGAYVGSVSKLMCLVHSECLESQYVSTRPFRINAGPVSSYILMEGGSTKYLSEVRGGDRVIVVDAKSGTERAATVGRAKIERRPFLLVEYEIAAEQDASAAGPDGTPAEKGQTILQQAETVRLFSAGGGVVSVTDLEVGDRILVRRDHATKMRHLGKSLGDGEMREQ